MIDAYGGIARVVPLFAALLTIVSLSSIGLPGTNGFVGEFLVLVGSFRTQPIWTVIAATGVIFAAAYLLWAIQRILFKPLDKPENQRLTRPQPARDDRAWSPLVIRDSLARRVSEAGARADGALGGGVHHARERAPIGAESGARRPGIDDAIRL